MPRDSHNNNVFGEEQEDPDKPDEGAFVIWMSNGNGLGDQGNVLIAVTKGGVTKYGSLFNYFNGNTW